MKTPFALALAAPVVGLRAVACTSTTSQNPNLAAADACSTQTAAFTLPGARITEAVTVEGNSVRPPGVTAGPLLLAHCRLTGRMHERTGVDGKPYHIGFELRLPRQWNGRSLYQGGGGNDGVLHPAVGPQAAPGYALNRGFAVVTTDAGHQGPGASFGFDPIARVDNAYNAHDRVAVANGTTVFPGRSRPLCAHPAYAHYDGGNTEDASSFSCRVP